MIDLMPLSARAKAARRANARRWFAAYGCVLLAGAVVIAGARVRTAALHREMKFSEYEVQNIAEKMTAVSEITGELDRIADQIELQRRIVPDPSPEAILRIVAASTPESMTLTSLLIDQRRGANSAAIRAARRSGGEEPAQTTAVQIAGVTPDDAGIVRLIQSLDRSGVFAGTSLEYSRPITVRGIEAREFRIVSSAPMQAPGSTQSNEESGG